MPVRPAADRKTVSDTKDTGYVTGSEYCGSTGDAKYGRTNAKTDGNSAAKGHETDN